jgi:flagellar basal-body rod protein FlgB
MSTFDVTSQLLTEMIHATDLRHRVLAGNLANVETPGYQAQEVRFDVALDAARAGGEAAVATHVETEEGLPVRQDGNTVDLDRQMAKLVQNTGWHNAMLQILNSRLGIMRQAMRDRG